MHSLEIDKMNSLIRYSKKLSHRFLIFNSKRNNTTEVLLSHEIINSNKDGTCAIFMHGILGSKRNWKTPATEFLKQCNGYKAVIIDHRGHGESGNLVGKNTVQSCAEDLYNTVKQIQPIESSSIVCGHSFGGKVALMYSKLLEEKKLPLPKHTWVLDSLPGEYVIDENESVSKVLDVVAQCPPSFSSRDAAIQHLQGSGIPKPIALWIATNLVRDSSGVRFIFDIRTILELFEDYCKVDLWNYLESYKGSGTIHFIRAGKNNSWTKEVLDRFSSITSSNKKVKLHHMPHVGHWLHSEDMHGMLKIIKDNTV